MEATIIFLLAFLGLGGLVGSISMLLKPDGSLLGLSTELLENAPVSNYFLPGIFLLFVMSVWPLVNIYGWLTGAGYALVSTVLLGVVCMVWIIYQYYTIRQFWFLQPIIFILGLLIAVCSLLI